MEKIRKELGKKLEKIWHVYAFAQEAYLYTEYFHNPTTKEELQLVTNSPHSSNLSTIMHIMFRTLINEVSKLYSHSDSDKFRLESFIKSLLPSGHFRKIGVPIKHIEQWQKQLDENKDIVDNILLLRSRVYAHTDNPMKNYNEIDISFRQVKVLLDLADEILKNIYGEVFNTGLLTDSPTFDRDRFSILKLAAKGEEARLAENLDNFKNWRRNRYMEDHTEEITSLETAIKNLIELAKSFGDKYELQTLGTVVQSTACFLTIAANTLDHGQRQLNFSKKEDWKNLISNINRFFYAHLHTAIEVELIEFSNKRGIKIESTVKRRLLKKYEKNLKQKILKKYHKDIEDFLQENTPDRPSSMDVLNSSLKETGLSEDEKKYFRIFYEALSILRNKSSHPDPSLNDYEKRKIKQAKLDFLISTQGALQSQPGHYFYLSKMVMTFLNNLS